MTKTSLTLIILFVQVTSTSFFCYAQEPVDPVAAIASSIQSCIDPIAEWCAAAAVNPNNVMHDCPVGTHPSTLQSQTDLNDFLTEVITVINGTIINETMAYADYTSNYNSILQQYGSMADEDCKNSIQECYAPDVERDSYIECINSTSNDLNSVANAFVDELNAMKDNCKKAHVSCVL